MIKIKINDQNMDMYIDFKENEVHVSFTDSKLKFLTNFINVIDRNNKKIVMIGNKKICEIKDGKVIYSSKITSTEIRVLSAIHNSLNKKNVSSTEVPVIKEKLKEQVHNIKQLNRFRWSDNQNLKTELHTHLIEILSAEEFLWLIDFMGCKIPVKDGELNFDSDTEYTLLELVEYRYKDNVANALKLDLTKKTTFDDLITVNKNRNLLLARCSKLVKVDLSSIDKERKEYLEEIKKLENKISNLREKSSKESNKKNVNEINRRANELKKEVGQIKNKINNLDKKIDSLRMSEMYSLLLEVSLKKLKYEGIEYSEISFSTYNTLKYLSDEYKDKDHSNFKLLMSIDRNKSVDSFKDASFKIIDLLKDNVVNGIDIIGLENKFDNDSLKSFEESLEWIVPVLHMYPNSVLRFHAGEFKDTTENVYKTLLALKRVKTKLNVAYKKLFGKSFGMVPPPRIRIGHAVNIEQKPELIELLKEFDCIVEFNISSNYALSHISDLSTIPIDYYDKNNIKYVFSTDGGGMYSTSLLQEENIAKNLQTLGIPSSTGKLKSNYIKKAKEVEAEVISISEPSYKLDIEEIEKEAKKYLEHLSSSLSEEKISVDKVVEKLLATEKNLSQEINNLYREMLDSDASIYDEYIYKLLDDAKEKIKLDETTDATVMVIIAKELKDSNNKFMNMIAHIDNEVSKDYKSNIKAFKELKNYVNVYNKYKDDYYKYVKEHYEFYKKNYEDYRRR